MGKYYCDYCDKEFQDTPTARKRHLQSSSHLRAKSLWYTHLHNPPPNPLLCHRFLHSGFCPFGDSCKYLHPSTTHIPTFQITPSISPAPGNLVRDGMEMSWGNLPPSLKPPPEGGYPPLPFLDWG